MAKFHGKIGFASQVESAPGVWIDQVVEHEYSGDILRFTRNTQNSQNVNDDISISNQFSIVADAYARENLYAMRYIEFMGAKWKVSSIEVEYPRLTISVGGVWNGEPH